MRPYSRVTLKFLAQELDLSEPDVETLLVDMIMDMRIQAQIDQITGVVTIIRPKNSGSDDIMNTLGDWADTLSTVTENFVNRTF